MGMLDLGTCCVTHGVAGEQQTRSDISIFTADHILGKAANSTQRLTSIGGKGVGAETGFDPQLGGIPKPLGTTDWRIVEATRLGAQQTGMRMRQLTAIGDTDIWLTLQITNNAGDFLKPV